MSFLGKNSSDFLSARITQKGRSAIAKGDFNIKFFQIGDSEFDYTAPFDKLGDTNNGLNQVVFAPMDKEGGVKYPYKFDSGDDSVTYGDPIMVSSAYTIRNVMGSAGFVSGYRDYDATEGTGVTVECPTQRIELTAIKGTNSITVLNGLKFKKCEYITLVFNSLGGTDANFPVIADDATSLVFKLMSVVGNDLILDRNTPDFSSLDGYAQVVCNNCEIEYPLQGNNNSVCSPTPLAPLSQLNPWKMNVVWGEKPIGFDVNGMDEGVNGFDSNKHVSTKQFLGYTSSEGQGCEDSNGNAVVNATTYLNSFNDIVSVTPNEQRCIAIIHYSEVGDLTNDPERFYRYDDYISTNDNFDDAIMEDEYGDLLTDREYFEVYLPFVYYHRNPSTSIGAKFTMGDKDLFIVSKINQRQKLLFRYLLDESGNKVGKVFPNNKIVVFDDQELVAMLEYRSNRRYTLPAPKVNLTPTDKRNTEALISGEQTQVVWMSYFFSNTTDSALNGLPCNYFSKVTVSADHTCYNEPSELTFKFADDAFNYFTHKESGVETAVIADEFHALVQITEEDEMPRHDAWKKVDLTADIPNHIATELIDLQDVQGVTFTVSKSDYDDAALYDIETYMAPVPDEITDAPQFGDEQPFAGSIRLVRATDIEEMGYHINLPSTQFTETQNPTYVSGMDKRVTEVALLNSRKEVMVVAKTAAPIRRVGTQILSVKLDF
jgi:hypothetical protein